MSWRGEPSATIFPLPSLATTTPIASPAIELVGCTTSQDKVASVISSLRGVDGDTVRVRDVNGHDLDEKTSGLQPGDLGELADTAHEGRELHRLPVEVVDRTGSQRREVVVRVGVA